MIHDVHAAWNAGYRNVGLVSPTGSGKSLILAKILKARMAQRPVCAIAHRKELVGQIALALARCGVRHSVIGPASLVKYCIHYQQQELGTSFYNATANCAVIAVRTLLARRKSYENWTHNVGTWELDECFPAGTLVDGRPIEQIRVGDFVTAFNEATGGFEQRQVVRLFKNPVPTIPMLRIAAGHPECARVVECTMLHPFWVRRGISEQWLDAVDLRPMHDKVLGEDGKWLDVSGMTAFYGDPLQHVYNLEVEGLHTYVANGIVVHNCHHLTDANEFGEAVKLFSNAHGLGVTATPCRADGKGLGRHAAGLLDTLVVGPTMRELINMGYLSDYRIVCPRSDLSMDDGDIGSTGDYTIAKMKAAAKRSHIVVDVVTNYRKFALGKRTIVFATDIETATDMASRFRSDGVRAQVVTGETPDTIRDTIIRQFRHGEIDILVNVDLFGEGFDVPAIECVMMARPTASYGLYCLDSETEILTGTGWKKMGEVCVGDYAASCVDGDPARGVWSKVTGTVVRPMDTSEKWIEYSAPRANFRVTDKHRMIFSKKNPDTVGYMKGVASELASTEIPGGVYMPSAVTIPQSGVPLSASDIYLIGMFMTDGSWTSTAAHIYQSERHPEIIERIEAALLASKITYRKSPVLSPAADAKVQEVYRRWRYSMAVGDMKIVAGVGKYTPHADSVRVVGDGGIRRLMPFLDKNIAPALMALSASQFQILLNSMWDGDGTKLKCPSVDWTPQSKTICTARGVVADRMQALGAIHGYTVTSRREHKHRANPVHMVTFTPKSHRHCGGHTAADRAPRPQITSSPATAESVWCVETEHGYLVTRRRGKVTVMGNCQMFGRGLRILPGKTHGLIIDTVGNVVKHGLPDTERVWSLDGKERRPRASDPHDDVKQTYCTACSQPYPMWHVNCPYCGAAPTYGNRDTIEQVEGDLIELSPEVLARMRGEVANAMESPEALRNKMRHAGAPPVVVASAFNGRKGKLANVETLQACMAWWAHAEMQLGRNTREMDKLFYALFGTDRLTALTQDSAGCLELAERIVTAMGRMKHVA